MLLLGAGASVPSSYPTGRQFVEQFLEQSAVDFSQFSDGAKRKSFDDFWRKAGEVTVDAFVKKARQRYHLREVTGHLPGSLSRATSGPY